MNRILRIGSAVGAAAVTGAFLMTSTGQTVFAQARNAAPAYRVQPFWPQPLPNHWVFGSITGVTVDAQDHVWVTHRGAVSLEGNEKGMMANPPTSSVCCVAAPAVMEFDATGKLVSSFGEAGKEPQGWPQSPGSIAVDGKGNIWVTGAGLEPPPPPPPGARGRGAAPAGRGAAATPPPADATVLKYSKTGQLLLTIGTAGKMDGAESQNTLNRPSAVAIDNAANEVYVADTGNRRIVVFNADTGAYKRHWGAYDPNTAAARQFRDVTCIDIAKDGNVYVCDRSSNRIQVFAKDGKFVKEGIISKNTRGTTVTGQFGVLSSYGSVWDIAFSSDAAQQHIFVADGHDKKVLIVQRDTLAEVGSLGDGGRQPGRFLAVGSIATDSRGNLYTGEQHHGKRVQKFVPGARR